MTIHKYILSLQTSVLYAPEGSEPLSVQYQGKHLCLWMKIRQENKPVRRYVYIYGTGQELSSVEQLFVGTVQEEGLYAWHIFLGKEYV